MMQPTMTKKSHPQTMATTGKNLVVIDPAVTDYQTLVDGVVADAQAIVLAADEDGVAQITSRLQATTGVTNVYIVSHGAPGCLYLGNSQLCLDTLYKLQDLTLDNHPNLKRWFEMLQQRPAVQRGLTVPAPIPDSI